MQKVAQIITKAIQRENVNLTELQVKTIQFGLECLLGELFKIIIYLMIFSMFSLTQYFIITMFFFSTLRLIAGGYHAKTYWGCFFVTLLIFGAVVGIGVQFPLPLYVRVLTILVSLILVWIYAPLDHPNKPIISEVRRKRFKYLSVMLAVLLSGVSFFLPSLQSGTAVVAILFESISLPVGKITQRRRF
ncbi:MAG: accessory regulator [Clostridiales bacterium]|jgi:accessory gene regulator B|nr:accessory regulator [Clostridiales bacterium]MDK2933633.1 accessory regulator [Clostridiales bacterium]